MGGGGEGVKREGAGRDQADMRMKVQVEDREESSADMRRGER